MTETPEVLSETPSDFAADPLSELLGSMHLAGVVLFRAEFREPWALIAPDAGQLAQLLPCRTEHIIPFHIVAAGGCWLKLKNHERVWLEAGDAVLLPFGDGHDLLGREKAEQAVSPGQLLPPPPWSDILVVSHGGGGERTHIICGFLQCDELLFHPILNQLPTLLHVRPGATDDWLASTIRHTISEVSQTRPGSRSMLPRLTELMFVEILRKHMQCLSMNEVGWFAAVKDPVVGATLKFLHTSPMRDWSVDELAHQVGVSRTVLAGRFKHFLDLPPMQYLARWRLQLAAQELKNSDVPIKMIADQAGYESEAAFSRAFKRLFGLPPGDWRNRQAQLPPRQSQ
jgi:AraC family transcriptional regulator, alkane utilization regulator